MNNQLRIVERPSWPVFVLSLVLSGICPMHAGAGCVPPPPSMISWWPADGDAKDLVGGNNGLLVNGAGFVPGLVGQAFSFTAANQIVEVTNSPSLDPTNAISLEAWVLVTSGPSTDASVIVGKDDLGAGRQYSLAVYRSGSQLVFLANLGTSGGFNSLIGTKPIAFNVWTHVALTYDGSALNLYVNGALDTSMALGGPIVTGSAPLTVGGIGSGPWSFFGDVDELSLYGRALSTTDIQAIYNAGSAGKCRPANLVSYNVSTDYSLAANPNGVWSYGALSNLSGAFTLLPSSRTFGADNGVPIAEWNMGGTQPPIVDQVLGPGTASSAGGAFTGPPGTVYFAPGAPGTPQNFGVVRFTAPPGGAGAYEVQVIVTPLFDGALSGESDFHVSKNGQELFGQFLGPNQSTGYTNIVQLASGDTVDFAIGRGADGTGVRSGLKVAAMISEQAGASTGPAIVLPAHQPNHLRWASGGLRRGSLGYRTAKLSMDV